MSIEGGALDSALVCMLAARLMPGRDSPADTPGAPPVALLGSKAGPGSALPMCKLDEARAGVALDLEGMLCPD